MKFRSLGQATLALAVVAGLATLITSCGGGHTIGYAYVLSNPASVQPTVFAFDIRSVNGALAVAQTPQSQGSSSAGPIVASVVAPDQLNLYVLYGAATDTVTGLPIPSGTASQVVHYSIEQDTGDIKVVESQNTAGNEAVGLAIDPSGNFLYAIDTYQAAFSPTNPGPGDVTVWPLTSGKLGTPTTYPVGYGPRGVNQTLTTASGIYLYVTNSGQGAPVSSSVCYNTISGFSVGSGGVLTPVNFGPPAAGSCNGTPYPSPVGTNYPSLPVGNTPWAITSVVTTANGTPFVYVTDFSENQVYAFSSTTSGVLSLASSGGVGGQGAFATGLEPENIIADPRATHLYISNFLSNTVSAYTITPGTGQLASIYGSPYATGTGPTCMAIDPSEGKYFYITNYLGGSVTGYSLKGTSGQLTLVPDEPFLLSANGGSVNQSFPACVSVVANGSIPVVGTP